MNEFDPNVIIVVVVSLIATEMVSMAGTCNEKALDDCYGRLRQSTDFRQMERNDTLFPTWNDTQLDLLCETMTKAENCAINVTVHCSSAEFQIYKGTDTTIFYLCGEGRQQYRNVRECFEKNAVRHSKSRCHGDLLEALNNLHRSTDTSHEERVLEICRHIDQSIECIRQDIVRECGDDAAMWTVSALNHQQRPAKEELRCDDRTVKQMQNLSPAIIFGIILLLLLATTVGIMTTLLVYRISIHRPNHHRLTLHHDIVKYNTTSLKGCGADGAIDESGGRSGGAGAGGRTSDHLTVPLMLSQSGLSATGKSVASADDINTPSTVGDG